MDTVGLDRKNRRTLFEVRYFDQEKKVRGLNVLGVNTDEATSKALKRLDVGCSLVMKPDRPGEPDVRFVAMVDVT